MNNWRKILSWKSNLPQVGELWCWNGESPTFDLRILDVDDQTVKYRAVRYHKTGKILEEKFTTPVTIPLTTFVQDYKRIEEAPASKLSWRQSLPVSVGDYWGPAGERTAHVLYVGLYDPTNPLMDPETCNVHYTLSPEDKDIGVVYERQDWGSCTFFRGLHDFMEYWEKSN